MSKYAPLGRFLRDSFENEVPLTFAKIEAVLGFSLPRSARTYPAWWANESKGHVQSRAWLDEGWQAWEVKLPQEKVLFRRRNAVVENSSRGDVKEVASATFVVSTDLRQENLSLAAARLLKDYTVEAGGQASKAIARALHEAAIARRGRLIDQITANAPRVPVGAPDSVELVREDRDGR
jgi:hypothetical protein